VEGERFLTTLTRTTLVAGLVALMLLVVLPRHAGLVPDFVDVFTIAFSFAFFGHYVERFLLALPQIEVGLGRLVRLAGWFAGGLWCYVVARWCWVHYGRDLAELPGLVWGGVFFVGLELLVHAALRARRQPNFYDPFPEA
jgi:hypothetical protein